MFGPDAWSDAALQGTDMAGSDLRAPKTNKQADKLPPIGAK
jgi:hypothetical protein